MIYTEILSVPLFSSSLKGGVTTKEKDQNGRFENKKKFTKLLTMNVISLKEFIEKEEKNLG